LLSLSCSKEGSGWIRANFNDTIAFFKREDARARQILADAGVLISAGNVASINPALNDPNLINQGRVNSAVNAWNNLQINTIPNLSAQLPQLALGSAEYVGNIATDYRFASGPVKGLRLGAGVNYRGGQVVGYRGSDTIRDPNDATRAIDDPTVNSGDAVIAPSYYKTVASLSYTFKFKKGRSLQLDINIDNVLNRREPVLGSSNAASGTGVTILVPRSGLNNPERVTVPGNIFYLIPRNYTLSAKYNF
jgi:hypothetical protein